MKTTKPHKLIAVLNLKISVHDLIVLAKAILSNMSSSTWFKTPVPPLATVTADTAALETAQVAALTLAKGMAAARDAKKAILVADLHFLKAYVQSVANADEANAQTIIESAGMSVRKVPARTKQDLVLKPGKVSGQVQIVAKAVDKRASYDWQSSADGKTWTALPSTLQARTTLTNQTPGTTIYVRHRAVTKAGVGDWGEPTTMLVV